MQKSNLYSGSIEVQHLWKAFSFLNPLHIKQQTNKPNPFVTTGEIHIYFILYSFHIYYLLFRFYSTSVGFAIFLNCVYLRRDILKYAENCKWKNNVGIRSQE